MNTTQLPSFNSGFIMISCYGACPLVKHSQGSNNRTSEPGISSLVFSLLWFWPAMESLACEATEARLVYWTWAFTWREKGNSRSWIWQSASVLLFYSVNKRQSEGRVQRAEQYVNILRLYWDQSTPHWCSLLPNTIYVFLMFYRFRSDFKSTLTK